MNKRNILVTLECFIEKDGKYLMLLRNPNKKIMPDVLMAPGGKREFNEGLFTAARREILEETGLHIKNLRIKAIGNAYLKDLDQEIFFHFVFADYAGGEVLQNPNDGQLLWLTPEEIEHHPNVLAEIKKVTSYIFQKNSEVISYTAVYEKGNELAEFEIEPSV
jgi:ADP-ribose pyrophosphatase YjhB (NUDIX family)